MMGKDSEDCNLPGVQASWHRCGPERLEGIAVFSAVPYRRNQAGKMLRGM